MLKDILIYLDSIKVNYKDIYIEIESVTYNNIKIINSVNDYTENIFTNLEDVKIQLLKNKDIMDTFEIDILSLIVDMNDIFINIYANLPDKINKKYYENKYESILCINRGKILSKIANINSLEYHSKILYKKTIDNIDKTISQTHNSYYNNLKEILSIL